MKDELTRRWAPMLDADPGAPDTGSAPAEPTEPEPPQDPEPGPKYTDKDVDDIVNKKFAKWQAKQAEEIAKAVEEAQKLAQMDAQEKAEHQRDELQKQLDELIKEKAITEMKATARGMLQAEGITAKDELVAALITDDAETTAAAVKAFAEMYQADIQQGIKEALKGRTPTRGSSAARITKEDIKAIKDPVARQKAIEENIELFSGYFRSKGE